MQFHGLTLASCADTTQLLISVTLVLFFVRYFLPSVDCKADGAEEVETQRSPSSSGSHSPVMDRNPSPPPDSADGDNGDLDVIGDSVYSKHWLFSTLTRLINVGCY